MDGYINALNEKTQKKFEGRGFMVMARTEESILLICPDSADGTTGTAGAD